MESVVFFVSTLNSGGIENYLLRFLRHNQSELRAIVVCKNNEFGELYEKYAELKNVLLVKLHLNSCNIIDHIKLFKILNRNSIKSVCDFSGNFAANTLFLAYLANVDRRIAFYRNSSYRFKVNPLRKASNNILRTITSKMATRVLFNSYAAMNFHFGDPRIRLKKFGVIYNGVNACDFDKNEGNRYALRQQLGITDDMFVIGHTGRFNPAKNHLSILKLAADLRVDFPKVCFVLAGKDTDALANHPIYVQNNLRKIVFCLGYRSDVAKLLNVFDLFLFPSITEGQPNSLIEAMVAGLPIVASNIDSIKEIVPPEYWARLKDPHDVAGFKNEVLSAYLENNQLRLQSWAVQKFDYYRQFALFAAEIL